MLQLERFESELCEAIDDIKQGEDGQRCILRCNPVRRDEIRHSRAERLATIWGQIAEGERGDFR